MKLNGSIFQISIQEKHFNHGKNANTVTPATKKPTINHSNHSTVTGSHIVNGHHNNHGNHSSTKASGNGGVNGNHGTLTTNGNSTVVKANGNIQKQSSNGSNGSAVSLERFVENPKLLHFQGGFFLD